MSYSLSLQRFQSGRLVPPDRAAVLAVLRRHCSDAGGRFESYDVGFSDGSRVELAARGLEGEGGTGPWWEFRVRELGPLIAQFIHDVALAGDCVIWNSMGSFNPAQPENPQLILLRAEQAAHLPKACPNTALCLSAWHLAQLLGPGFARWQDSFKPRRSWIARLMSVAE